MKARQMIRLMFALILMTSGCINISARLQPEDTSVKALKMGSDCVHIILGLGFGTADIEHAKRQRAGLEPGPDLFETPITKVRRVELTDRGFLGLFAERCVEVTGE